MIKLSKRYLNHQKWLQKALPLICSLVLLSVYGCSAQKDPVFHPTVNPISLSDWNVLKVTKNSLSLNKNVIPYDLNSALFTDYAHKLRTVWVPSTTNITYSADDALNFPVGSIISKTFYYPVSNDTDTQNNSVLKVKDTTNKRLLTDNKKAHQYSLNLDEIKLIETRLLVHRKEGWIALPYVWNDEQTEATLKRTGDIKALTLQHADNKEQAFNYIVPDANQCAGCHATNASTRKLSPIGIKARHLNKTFEYSDGISNQLQAWTDKRILSEIPEQNAIPQNAVWNDTRFDLDKRARSYLDINCSHCHNKVGPADTSGLLLEPSSAHGPSLGLCKLPIAAGTGTGNREYGIVPGKPDDSIMLYRMQSVNPAEMMPELGRSLSHDEGVDLITEWVASLPGSCK